MISRELFELVVGQAVGITTNPALLDRPMSSGLPFADHLPGLDCSADLAALLVVDGLGQVSFHGSTVSSLKLARSQSTSGSSISIPASTFFWRHGEQARRGLFTFTPSRPTRKVSSIVSNPTLLELQVDVGWTILHDKAEMVANRQVTASDGHFPKAAAVRE